MTALCFDLWQEQREVGLVLKLSGSSRLVTHMSVVPDNASLEGTYGGPLPDTLLLSLKTPVVGLDAGNL